VYAKFQGAISEMMQGRTEALEQLGRDYNLAQQAISSPGALSSHDGTYAFDDGDAVIWTDSGGTTWLKHPAAGKMTLSKALLTGVVSR